MIFFSTRVSSIFSPYLFIWFYMTNTLAKYSKILSDSSICNFSKSSHNFYRRTFFTLSAYWFDSCKTFHIYLTMVVLATILKVTLSRHWWMIVSTYWSFLRAFCTTSLLAEVNIALSIGSSRSISTISHAS